MDNGASGGGQPVVFPQNDRAQATVNTGNGSKLTALQLFSFPVRGGMDVDFTLYHNSQSTYNDELGHGWTWSYDMYINDSETYGTVHWGDDLAVPFGFTGSGYAAPAGIYDKLVKNPGGTWTLTRRGGQTFTFNSDGFLTQIQDRNGNAITLTLNVYNYVTRITAPDGRHVDITLDVNNNFTTVTAPDGRTWSFTRNGSDDLTEVIWPTLSGVTYKDQFAYGTHRITTYTDHAGKAWSSTYNSDGSLATESNPLGKTTNYDYQPTYFEMTDPLGKTVRHTYSSGRWWELSTRRALRSPVH